MLRQLYVDAWLAGMHTAREQVVTKAPQATSDAVGATDWASWTPGDITARDLTIDGGLRDMLDAADVTIQGIGDTTIDRIGNVIAQGLGEGSPLATITAGIGDYISNPDRAFTIAQTETSRAMVSSQASEYQTLGFAQFEWLAYDGACEDCMDQEDANPHDFGDDQPPGHPNCRCSIVGTGDVTTPEGALTEGDFAPTPTEDSTFIADNFQIIDDAMRVYRTRTAAEADLTAIRDEMLTELRAERDHAAAEIDTFGGAIRKPANLERTTDPITGARTYRSTEGGEYDWWYRLDQQERQRLIRNGYVSDSPSASNIDAAISAAEHNGRVFESPEAAVEHWLNATRTKDTVDTIESKKSLPSSGALERQMGGFDPNRIISHPVYDVSDIWASKTNAVDYLMSLRADPAGDAWELVNRDLMMPERLGPSPYEMSATDYATKTFDLWGQMEDIWAKQEEAAGTEFGHILSDAERQTIELWKHFMPESLVPDIDADVDVYQIHAEMVQLARLAGVLES